MIRTVSVSSITAVLLVAACSRQPNSTRKPAECRVLCGSSMAGPAQKVVELFRKRHQAEVLLDVGGSETLLPKILAGVPADVFICHDPFEQKLKDAGRWAGSAIVGVLQPALLVRPGNPRNIHSVADLTRPDLKIGIGDPRYSTCGEVFVQLLESKGLVEPVMKQVRLQGRTHAEIANGLILGPLDAVVVWNCIAHLYSNKVERVRTDERYPPIHVTVVGLQQGSNPGLRDAFLELCRSEEVRAVFAEHGYVAE